MRVGGIILCGGQSKRMGLPKATLPFGPELMLERVLRLLGDVVQPLVVVAAPSQTLPRLPAGVLVARDEREGQGPLEGLYAGLSMIAPHAEAAYTTSCDVPLLSGGFVRRLMDRLEDRDVIVPVEGTFHHPLAGIYRTRVLPHIRQLLDTGRMRPVFLFEEVSTCRIPLDELRDVDPELHTLANLNTPHEYLAALEQAGFTAPDDVLARLASPPRES